MDYLHIPPGCKTQMREIPYLGIAPKYDRLGFDGFPERHDRNPDEVIATHSILKWRADYIESFVQEWLFFGLLDEFSKACDISINLDDFVIDSSSSQGRIITTASIYDVYARRLAIRQLDIYAVTLGLEMGDLVRLPYDPSALLMHQITDFWRNKMEKELPSPQNIMVRAAEQLRRLSEPHGEDTKCQDQNGITVPLHALYQRIVESRTLMTIINPDTLSQGIFKAKWTDLAKCISRAQRALCVMMDQLDPVVSFDIIVSIDILCHTLARIIEILLEEKIELRSPSFMRQFEKIMVARNWCPSRISLLGNAVNTPMGYLASLLPSYEGSSHGGCSPRKCLKRPSTLETMPKLHRENCNKNCSPTPILEVNLINM
jgi:hypothetical protein